MTSPVRTLLLQQLQIAWALTEHHLESLTTEECLWRPASRGLHVLREADGRWVSEWPEHERPDLGPPSIAWLTWHVAFWWSMVLDHSFGNATLTRQDVSWPGSADGVRALFAELKGRWQAALEQCNEEDLQNPERSRWPISERPLADIAGWVNLELMKNAAEIGYARFLYAVRS